MKLASGYVGPTAIPPHVAEFWAGYRAAAGAIDDSRFYEAFCFGDSEELANRLAKLVARANQARNRCNRLVIRGRRQARSRDPGTSASSRSGAAARSASSKRRGSMWCRFMKSPRSSRRSKAREMGHSATGGGFT